MTENNWIWTDPDCSQFVRDAGNGVYECIQIQAIAPNSDEYAVVYDRIDFSEYEDSDFRMCAEMYGYDSLEAFKAKLGPAAPQIMAECLFESISCFQQEKYRAIGPYEYCRFWIVGFLYEWEERHGCLKDD